MNSRTSIGCLVMLMALPAAPVPAAVVDSGETLSHEAAARSLSGPLSHHVLLGAGLTVGGPFDQSIHPGVMLGLNAGLGTYAAIGLTGDFTYGGESSAGAGYEFLTALELKLLPEGSATVRPWVSGGLAASIIDDFKLGLGVGGGMYFAPAPERTYFVDVRHYRLSGFETLDYGQTMLRFGLAF